MRKLFIGVCMLFTLNSYSQYDDIYYTVDDYNAVVDTDITEQETDTYITNNYYTEYPSYSARIRRFHSDLWYISYWSLSNIFWYSWYNPYDYWYSYSWYNPYWNYYGYYGWNYYNNYWYSHHHHNHWYNNHYYAHNSYYGPHYRKSTNTSNGNVKTIVKQTTPHKIVTKKEVKTVAHVKPKPVTKNEVKTVAHVKPKPVTTSAVKTYTYNNYNRPKPSTKVTKSYNHYNRPKPSTKVTKSYNNSNRNKPVRYNHVKPNNSSRTVRSNHTKPSNYTNTTRRTSSPTPKRSYNKPTPVRRNSVSRPRSR